ncbi:ParB/RepB/Spo0J family partition protein [Streptomyces sp. Isolate_45]|uniref:ParB/RepB/Spo0J family partition protein n=1 Tax=Streptomyces sp. Isolate_45 TaxID=2950111 RepID=UPI002481C1B0|nr:ParB/RepB/Spo0J family partition protein [Streptomyces sp. Isolate_45]MDA5281179.1 ParB/RepB/Spo0J family partition protein [Streptomyces sp. Isolate_45]
MSKADMLGDSPTFNAVAQPMSSRAASFARFAGQDAPPADQAPAATAGTLRVPLEALAHNPYNPREELKSVEDLADSLTSRGVIQPLAAVTRQAFLAAHPGHEAQIGQAAYVVVDGNRRLAAANLAGLDDLPVHVDDTLAQDADTLLETALIAAVQHENLDPLDEAKALQRLVDVHGSQRAVARALGKSSPWVTQRIALLKLTPELQSAVEDRTLPVEIARNVGQLPEQQQKSAAEEALAKRAATKRRKQSSEGANTVTTAEASQGANAVSTPPSPAAVAPVAAAEADAPASDDGAKHSVFSTPEAVPFLVDLRSVPRLPWDDGIKVAEMILERMDAAQRKLLLERLLAAHGEE